MGASVPTADRADSTQTLTHSADNPRSRPRRRLAFVGFGALLLALLVVLPAVANAAPPTLFWETGKTGAGAGQTEIPRGIAASPVDGHVFVADQSNNRIEEFTAWGVFVKAWGWDVVASGPGDDTSAPEDELESCVPANGDVCQAGTEGEGSGQLILPQGVAVDSNGDVYVVDVINRRVMKFDPSAGPSGEEAQFVFMLGGQVNRTKVEAAAPEAEQNLCTAASGDACQAGVEGTGSGQFGGPQIPGATITVDPADNVYVGDQGRIQRFDAGGAYQSEISLPGEVLQSLASDAAGNLYAAYDNKADVRKLSPTGAPLSPTFKVQGPSAIAVDPAGNVYVFDQSAVQLNNAGLNRPPLIEFDPAGNQLESFGKSEFTVSTGLATGSTCLSTGSDLYASNQGNSFYGIEDFLRAYGPPPDKAILCPPPKAAPEIEAQFAVAVDSDGAQLRAAINPRFWPDATYFVQFGTQACLEAGWEAPCVKSQPSPPAELGAGSIAFAATTPSVFLAGLQPETTYRYRFVAESGGGGPVRGAGATEAADGAVGTFTTPPLGSQPKTDCPNQTLRYGASAFLPNCRAFELVSPVDKNGAGIETALLGGNPLAHALLDQSDGDGEALAYSSKQAFGDAIGSPYSSQYLAHRDPGHGWSTHGINAPREGFPGLDRLTLDTEYRAFSEDLTQGWMIHDGDPPLAPCAPANSPDLYRRDNLSDSYEALHCEPNQPKNASNTIEFQGVSADGCRAVFRSNSKLTEDAEPTGSLYQLYESSCEGPLRLVSVLPNGTVCKEESSAGSELLNVDGAINDGRRKSLQNALSADARRLYWECDGTLYLRTDPAPSVEGETGEGSVEVAAPSGPSVGKQFPPRFQSASRDGGRMLFSAYDVGSGGFVLRSYEPGSYEPEGVEASTVAGVFDDKEGRVDLLGAGEDARRVYLVSGEKLSEVPNGEGDEAEAGKANLYFHEEGGGFDFIGTLSGLDLSRNLRVLSPVHPLRFRRASRVSPDGLHAAFISSTPLTGYDNTDALNGEADKEVFVYDAAAKQLRCVSCNPTGARPSGANISTEDDIKEVELWAAAWIPGWTTQLYQGRPFSEDGSRLFFNSVDALVPRDGNGRQDVYEWEAAESKQECLQEKGAELYVADAGGCLSLVSSGTDAEDSAFVDADRDGSDVFIRTGQSLLPQDPGLIDIYDARVGGGFPQPTAVSGCEGEACQGPPSPPDDPTPASSAFAGAGNVKAAPGKPRCAKGKARRKGRCVAKKHKGRNRLGTAPQHDQDKGQGKDRR